MFILLSSDYFLPNREKKSENYTFLDASLRYRPKNKQLEFNFTAKNLLNEANFEQIQTSDFSTNIYRTNILPRYYLLNMTYNF
ncbi:MAG: TonB-dependent receptor [Lutibacter sp.]|nr:TonB-dependent receptor [Lutibacter sp.]